MSTFDAGSVTLEKVRDFVWEIPQDGDMRVPARVLASETLLSEIAEDKTLEQLRNTTHLPGIQKYAICMPDGHQGYGFPVGGVAGIDAETGCISPGAVGYDINCLAGESDILLKFGRRRPIRDLHTDFEEECAVVAADEETVSPIQLFTKRNDRDVYKVTTAGGGTIEATPDHPFLTPNGMTDLESLKPGDEVFAHPFKGLPDEDPSERIVLDEADFKDAEPHLLTALQDQNLLPLRSTDEAFCRLLKLVGYHSGNGTFQGNQSKFYGKIEDLESIQADIEALGFTTSCISRRNSDREIEAHTLERMERGVLVTSQEFRELLERLGAPVGQEVDSDFTLPAHLERLPDWQRALYLSAFFGAAMSAPDSTGPRDFSPPTVTNSLTDHFVAGEQFMRGVKDQLEALGINTNALEEIERTETKTGTRSQFRFELSPQADNLIRFFTTIGYRYADSKQQMGLIGAQYLKENQQGGERHAGTTAEAKTLADGGSVQQTHSNSEVETNPFVEWSCGNQQHEDQLRRPASSLSFEDFNEERTIREDMSIATRIVDIEYSGSRTVYDIGVVHDAHNFVANGFVVSNCGVRMVRTNLTYGDVRGHEVDLVNALFANIPSGLGGGGVFEGSITDVEAILDRGMDWALEHDYARETDLEHCEDEGRRPDAEASAVSEKAMNRGKNQVGSLGSGNHFLEVQRVTDVFLDEVASDFGLHADQIVVLIHCGSRGLGHQVCTDFLREIEQTHAGMLEQLPDKELAAAPAGSQLADEYYRAMCAAINFAWVNRQLITHRTRRVFEKVFDADREELGMEVLYDVAHNIAKKEVHNVDGKDRELFVHRKGATRAFPAGRPEVPEAYREVGQPIIIPGSMGAGSYVLRGGEASLEETFGSTAHGAGRLMSRTQAKNEFWGEDVMDDLREQDKVYVKAQSGATVAEEAPGVYKDVDEVVRVSDALGIGDKVVRTFPVCNIKG